MNKSTRISELQRHIAEQTAKLNRLRDRLADRRAKVISTARALIDGTFQERFPDEEEARLFQDALVILAGEYDLDNKHAELNRMISAN